MVLRLKQGYPKAGRISHNGQTGMNNLDVRNPRTGEIDYQVAAVSATQVKQLSEAMRDAQKRWNDLGVEHRCKALLAWAEAIKQNAPAIGEALCLDTGRRLMSHIEVDGAARSIERWAELAPSLLETKPPVASKSAPSVNYHHKLVPYGIVGVISPWNFPLTLSLIDTIPALLSGASVLLKPSEVTPRFIAPLQAALDQVDELKDVLKIVTGGPETGIALIDHVDTICFTGSVPTGRKVGMQAAGNFIPAFLELGGKDPAVVLADADLDNATTAILRGSASVTGQACQSLERVYVHDSIFDKFVSMLTSKAQQANYNWPDIDSGQLGPLIFAAQADTIESQINDAVAAGAKVHCGGKVARHNGSCWIGPTVMTEVNHSMDIMSRETFGPIMPIMPFSNTEEAIELANDSDYGLSGAVFGTDTKAIEDVALNMNVGAVSINDASLTAFVNDAEKNSFRLSGIGGSRMGEQGFMRFLRKRAILVQTAPAIALHAFSEGSKKA